MLVVLQNCPEIFKTLGLPNMDFPNHFCASLFYSIQKAEVKLRVSKQSLQIEKALYEERKIGVIDLDMFSRLQLSET